MIPHCLEIVVIYICLIYPSPIKASGLGCGGVLTTLRGFIFYKPEDSSFGQEERCHWILRTPKATDYDVIIQKFPGVIFSQDRILAFSFSDKGEYQRRLRDTNVEYNLRGGAVVISFYSPQSDIPSKGFQLSFRARVSNEAFISQLSDTSHYPQPGELTVKYPRDRDIYESNELGVILRASSDCFFTEFYTAKFTTSLEDSKACLDYITLYTFKPFVGKSELGWHPHAKLCGMEVPGVTYVTREAFLLIFRSDGSNNGAGFTVKFSDKIDTSSGENGVGSGTIITSVRPPFIGSGLQTTTPQPPPELIISDKKN